MTNSCTQAVTGEKDRIFVHTFSYKHQTKNVVEVLTAKTLVVILEAQVGNQILSSQMAQSVFQLHQLNEDIMLWVQSGSGLR